MIGPENLIADIIFLILLGLIGWLLITLTRRRMLQLFFGVLQNKRIVIYLSNLRVLTFGAVGISGRKMSYQGSAVAYGEMKAAFRIRRLFSFVIPALEESSDFLRRLLISDVSVDLAISPLSKNEIEARTSFITLGSTAYNVASKAVEEKYGESRFRFGILKKKDIEEKPFGVRPTAFSTDAEPEIMHGGTVSMSASLMGNERVSEEKLNNKSAILIEGMPPFEDTRNSFVQRTVDKNNNRSLFYVAGLSEHSTEGAANYLVSEWHKLYKKFGSDTSFLVVLRISRETTESWTVLFDKIIGSK